MTHPLTLRRMQILHNHRLTGARIAKHLATQTAMVSATEQGKLGAAAVAVCHRPVCSPYGCSFRAAYIQSRLCRTRNREHGKPQRHTPHVLRLQSAACLPMSRIHSSASAGVGVSTRKDFSGLRTWKADALSATCLQPQHSWTRERQASNSSIRTPLHKQPAQSCGEKPATRPPHTAANR